MGDNRIVKHLQLRYGITVLAQRQNAVPSGAGGLSCEFSEALMRLLPSEIYKLLAIMRDSKLRSLGELAASPSRVAPNLSRSFAKLNAAGFVIMDDDHRRKASTAITRKLAAGIDPFSQNDRMEIA